MLVSPASLESPESHICLLWLVLASGTELGSSHKLNEWKEIDDMERTWHLVGIFSHFSPSPDPRADPPHCMQADDVESESQSQPGCREAKRCPGHTACLWSGGVRHPGS